MNCSRCGTENAPAGRFCQRCGEPLDTSTHRSRHFAAQPNEPVRALSLMSTLMPHASGHRHHAYRDALGLCLLLSLVAAAFGALPVALVCAAMSLPILFLLYLHDHDVWGNESLLVIGVGYVLAGAFGFLVGQLFNSFRADLLVASLVRQLPSASTILETGLVVPLVSLVALVIGPAVVTRRSRFTHAVDAVTMSAVTGAAFALARAVTIQHDAFSYAGTHHTDGARDAFIVLKLGVANPVVFACAAALIVMRLRRTNGNVPLGIVQALVLIVALDMSSVLLNPYGARGVVLSFAIAVVLAAFGLMWVRTELHSVLVDDAAAQLSGGTRTVAAGTPCAHCGLPLAADAAFCPGCGTAVAAMPRQLHVSTTTS